MITGREGIELLPQHTALDIIKHHATFDMGPTVHKHTGTQD